VRHARVPAADLANPLQRERLAALRDEGVSITAMWIWSDRCRVAEDAERHGDLLDGIEIQLPSALHPDAACLDALRRCAAIAPVTLAPLLPKEIVPGKQHARTRIGYHVDELASLDAYLGEQGASVDRVLCRVDAGQDPWEAIGELRDAPRMTRIGAVDWGVEFGDADTDSQTPRAVAALTAVATLSDARLYLEPLVDFDRTMDIPPGLLERLCNPRPVFHALRTLNTVLFSDSGRWETAAPPDALASDAISLRRGDVRLALMPGGAPGRVLAGVEATHLVELESATRHDVDGLGAGDAAGGAVLAILDAAGATSDLTRG
jgi:hypothetical protein